MSRLSKLPLLLPSGVEIELMQLHIIVKGTKGELKNNIPKFITISQNLNKLYVTLTTTDKKTLPYLGLGYSIIKNMIEGVSKGFSKKLQMVGIGYKANYTNSTLTLNVGYSHPIKFLIPAEINLKIDNFTNITIDGIDKQLVGDLASKIRNIRSPEPYKGKGIRYTNEVIRYKAGKSGKK